MRIWNSLLKAAVKIVKSPIFKSAVKAVAAGVGTGVAVKCIETAVVDVADDAIEKRGGIPDETDKALIDTIVDDELLDAGVGLVNAIGSTCGYIVTQPAATLIEKSIIVSPRISKFVRYVYGHILVGLATSAGYMLASRVIDKLSGLQARRERVYKYIMYRNMKYRMAHE